MMSLGDFGDSANAITTAGRGKLKGGWSRDWSASQFRRMGANPTEHLDAGFGVEAFHLPVVSKARSPVHSDYGLAAFSLAMRNSTALACFTSGAPG
jgi:hypothetical protein